MRRPCFLVVALVLSAAPAAAQTTLALYGGVSRSTFTGVPDDIDLDPKIGANMGVSIMVPTVRDFGFRLAYMYRSEGGGKVVDFLGESINAEVDLIFAEVDVLARAVLVGNVVRSTALYLLAGPWIGFQLSCTQTVSAMGVSASEDCTDTTSTNTGAAFGIGGQIGVADRIGLSLDALYNVGFSDLDETPEFTTRSRSLLLLAGLVLEIG